MSRGIALLGEVEENSMVARFEALEARLPEALLEANRAAADRISIPLVRSGSFLEFAGVLQDLGAAYRVARTLAEIFHPLAVRVAAARGEVRMASPEPDMDPPDGSAFDLAGELLYRTRKEDRMLLVHGGGEALDRMANAFFLQLFRNLHLWTGRQCEVIRLYRRYRRQRDVARDLGVSQQSVSSCLSAAGWKALVEAETSIESVLAGIGAESS